MANTNFLVIRLHPDSPVDGATFAGYLNGLDIKVYPAGAAQTAANLLGEASAGAGTLSLSPDLGAPGGYVSSVSQMVTTGTQGSGTNYGTTLDLKSVTGIAAAATAVYSPNTKLFGGGATVSDVTSQPNDVVTLSQNIPNYVAVGTSVTFYYVYASGSISVDWSAAVPSFTVQGTASAKVTNKDKVPLKNTAGIAVGMTASGPSGIPAGTTVVNVSSSDVQLSSNNVSVANNATINFSATLSSGIVQHIEQLPIDSIITIYVAVPAAIATVIIPVTGVTSGKFLDVDVVATRNGIPVPVDNSFYNVIVTSDTLPTPDLYQSIPLEDTSLYITLPAPPPAAAIPLTMPSDGTPPDFEALRTAIQAALKADPVFPAATDMATLNAAQCSRLAYDIVWSQQNALPLPPDPLESLYTQPPNDGSANNNDEQDRQHFEGTLKSFYGTHNAAAQQLAKFVSAVAAAVWCEEQSLAATRALLAFPVNPGEISKAPVGDAQVILTGLGKSSPNNINFGVPAEFFYALGATLAAQVTPLQRYQMACGDTIDRVLSDLSSAVESNTIKDTAGFVSPSAPAGTANTAQAARRIAALAVSSQSPTPPAPLGTISAPITAAVTSSGTSLTMASTSGITNGMIVDGSDIAAGITVSGTPTATSVPLSGAVASSVAQGTLVTFTPHYSAALLQLTNDWLAYPPTAPSNGPPTSAIYQPTDDDEKFWPAESSAAATAQAFLELLLSALTQAYVLPTPDNVALGTKIEQWLSSATVTALTKVSAAQWTTFFQQNPGWLPPFTQPGNTTVRIAAFVRYVQTFFDMPPPVQPTISAAAQTSLPSLGLPSSDWLQSCVDAYKAATGKTVTFGSGFDATAMLAAAAAVFTDDAAAQAWAVEALQAIDQLTLLANGVTAAPAGAQLADFRFSIMEALYARGFTSVAQVQDLTSDQFTQALIGTVAYDSATALYTAAGGNKQPAAPGSGTLIPVNPGGSLTNCVPPPCRSPLGPIAYLKEMLEVSEASTCANPCATPAAGRSNLGAVLATRRGDVGSLAASCANLETPLPLIDLANECLEYMGSVATPATGGIVYDTNGDELAKHVLCKEERCPPDDETPGCHNPPTIFAALPEHATPATPPANSTVEPAVHNNLKRDFSACCLPYSQALDVNRTYLRHFCTSRFEEMRTFRKCITEFVLSPDNEPAKFQSYVWCYPVRIDIAIEYLGITPDEYSLLFQGDPAPACAADVARGGDGTPPSTPAAPNTPQSPGAAVDLALTGAPAGSGGPAAPAGATPGATASVTSVGVSTTGLPGTGAPSPATAPPTPSPATAPPAPSPAIAQPPAPAASVNAPTAWQLYGFAAQTVNAPPWPRGTQWTTVLSDLSQFLDRTCLSYCEFLELQQCGLFTLRNRGAEDGKFPECPPCYLDKTIVDFGATETLSGTLTNLAIFIRLWRILRRDREGYSFAQLRDICDVLQFFTGGALNPGFIRQLAAFQMLRDEFRMALDDRDDVSSGAIDAQRTHLLALWAPNAAKWAWAVQQLVDGVENYALRHYECERRPRKFLELMRSNLDALSQLAGFDPTSTTDNWHAAPTHTLRFAEVLAKIYASDFSIREIFYLFTVDEHLYGQYPFPLQENNEALASPLDLPDDQHEHSLWHLRRKLLEVEVAADQDLEDWNWRRIEAEMQNVFGFANQDVFTFGRHFFPRILERAGYQVDAKSVRFFTKLTSSDPAMWAAPPESPFEYDATGQQLSAAIPLADEAVIAKLTHVQALSPQENAAVQQLYFQPRAILAQFALLFSDFAVAEKHLIEEREEKERWSYFRRQFVRCHRRCRVIAEHLSGHVADATRQECPEGEAAALLILRNLFADENELAPNPPPNTPPPSWENDDGTHPAVLWTPPPNGGGFAALLALVGTGLVAEYKPTGGPVVWRDVCGPLSSFGRGRDTENCPVPTLLPAMNATAAQPQFASVLNGFLIKNGTGRCLGGAQGFDVTWSGALLVERDGAYEFSAGAPTPDGENPDFEAAEHRKWRVTLKRGQRSWTLLSHLWPGETERAFATHSLRRGAYDITVEFSQPAPDFKSADQVRPQRTGFQVKYAGPDSHGQRVAIPHDRLFCVCKDHTLADGILRDDKQPCSAAVSFLNGLYVGSLRDIRRTYQRAFKALLFVHRLALSADRRPDGNSELAYMLENGANFAGYAFYRSGSGFMPHAANFDFNYLPVRDPYYPPTQDQRADPSVKRVQALFQWFERQFNCALVRRAIRHRCGRQLWHLFEEASQKQPADPGYLLGDMGAEAPLWPLELRYYQGQSAKIYAVSSTDLEDERWVVRAWHADRWLRTFQSCCPSEYLKLARPDLWASDDPSTQLLSEKDPGNANLSALLGDVCFESGAPRRYGDVKRLNDGLRERGRDALVAYLCRMNRVQLPWTAGTFANCARDLTDLLLLDVEAGVCERASRIEEAITAAQNFVRRARIGLEPQWNVTPEFALMWDRRFVTFRVWEACRRRELYKENWIEWEDLEKARRVEAFRLLESELRRNTLTVARPGGGVWWPDQRAPEHPGMRSLQERDPSAIAPIRPTREGFGLSGTPERDARPSWLAPSLVPSQGSGGSNSSGSQSPIATPIGAALPYWMQAAIRKGTRFCRVAAAGTPPAAAAFRPHHHDHAHACCAECGCDHPPVVDEYYFWLVDAPQYAPPNSANGSTNSYEFGYQNDYYDPVQQDSVPWQDETQLPTLLAWQPGPAVRIAWCRVHNGEFQQPRRSAEYVGLTAGTTADLVFAGREVDSLVFVVANGVAPTGYAGSGNPNPDPASPGFRYDIARDCAVSLPLLAKPPAPPTFLGVFPAYPLFVYVAPGAPLFPYSPFAPAMAVASTLRAHCRFEAALQWYRMAFDPLANDCTWVDCPNDWRRNPNALLAAPGPMATQIGNSTGGTTTTAPAAQPVAAGTAPAAPSAGATTQPNEQAPVAVTVAPGTPAATPAVAAPAEQEACCQSTGVTDAAARQRSIVLHCVETLLEWHAALMRRHSPESFHQARLLLDTAAKILGPRPITVCAHDGATTQTVTAFQPAFALLNPRLLDAYDRVADGIDVIHHCLNERRLRNGVARCDMPYFGDEPLREGWRSTIEVCSDEAEWCYLHSPYRYTFLLQKAQELVAKTRDYHAQWLAACEKGDAEYLASLHATQEREVLELQLAGLQDQWRDADWQVEALQKSKEASQANLRYYNNLIQNGLIDDETQYETLTVVSMVARAAGNITEGIGEALKPIPDVYVGFPCEETWVPSGTKLAGMFESAARIINVGADITNATAGLDLTEAGWQRRAADWVNHAQGLTIDIQRIERQILGAQRQRDQHLHDINAHRRRMEQATEVADFLRDKFTADDLYLWLEKEWAGLRCQMLDLAVRALRHCEHKCNFELGYTTHRFVPEVSCNSLHEGLLAGERLELALHRMEKTYLERNVREYELTKHFSLRLHFPMAYLRLRTTGYCEIELPEWMFDLDYPGQYMRRIKNVTLTIPCQTGPYTGVHCRLTLLSSMTRIDPRLPAPMHRCCDGGHRCDYDTCGEDPRVVRQYEVREAIATSSGQNDAGLFQLNFNDERYLPFEYRGAVSRWRIEMPMENNFMDYDALYDLALNLNYTSREGGIMLRRAASEAAERRLREGRWSFFDVRHEFPDAWQLFRDREQERERECDGRDEGERGRERDYWHGHERDRADKRDDDGARDGEPSYGADREREHGRDHEGDRDWRHAHGEDRQHERDAEGEHSHRHDDDRDRRERGREHRWEDDRLRANGHHRDHDRDDDRETDHDREHWSERSRVGERGRHHDGDEHERDGWEHDHDGERRHDRDRNGGRNGHDGDYARDRRRDEGSALDLRLGRNMFPFIPGGREIEITGVVVMFQTECQCGCDCCEVELRAWQDGEDEWRAHDDANGDRREHDHCVRIRCVPSGDWPRFYYGAADVELGSLGNAEYRRRATLRFSLEVGKIERVFLFVQYRPKAETPCCAPSPGRPDVRPEHIDRRAPVRLSRGALQGVPPTTS